MKTICKYTLLLSLLFTLSHGAESSRANEKKNQGNGPAILCRISYTPALEGAKSEEGKIYIHLREADEGFKIGEKVKFKDMAFSTRFARDYLAIDIVNLDNGRAICRHVYNLGKNVRNQFEGDNGFTGLIYVFHPKSGAEMQFYCSMIGK